jgi:hypothetical protein
LTCKLKIKMILLLKSRKLWEWRNLLKEGNTWVYFCKFSLHTY